MLYCCQLNDHITMKVTKRSFSMSDAEHKHDQHHINKPGGSEQSDSIDHGMHDGHAGHSMADHSAHDMQTHEASQTTTNGHTEHVHHTDHSGHEQMFRSRFWGSLLLSVPVLLFNSMIQEELGFRIPSFVGSEWIPFIFALIVFVYGGIPFIQMAVPEIQNREPGMMTLISLAISVALVYSVAAQIFGLGEGFFWELVTLIDIMLLGHWLEMRSVRQASGALNELAKLLPDTAELVTSDGSTKNVSVSSLRTTDVVLVRPGSSIPA